MERALLNVRSTYSLVFMLLLSFNSLIVTKSQPPFSVGDDCDYTTQRPLTSAYKTNVNNILSWLSSDALTSKGYNHKTIGNNNNSNLGHDNAVYGLYDCRGDVVGYFCQFCVSTASRQVLQHCPNRVSVTMYYNFCILRYSNHNFFGNVTTSPIHHMVGAKNVSSVEEIQKSEDFMRSLIRKATVETNQLYYMDGFNLSSTQRRYGLVQCSRDLTNEGCRQCLQTMLEQVPKCCERKLGWFVGAASCHIKYDDYMFYLFDNQSYSVPHVPNPTAKQGFANKSSRNLIIGLSVLGLVALLCLSVSCLWCRNEFRKDGLLLDAIPLSAYTNLPTIPLITILETTDNFSETSKLGEGGFGPVYKWNCMVWKSSYAKLG